MTSWRHRPEVLEYATSIERSTNAIGADEVLMNIKDDNPRTPTYRSD
jgi:hypothetical protein